MSNIKLSDIIAPHFKETFLSKKTYQIDSGGRNSTKSSKNALKIAYHVISEKNCSAIILRRYQTDLRKSVYKEMKRTEVLETRLMEITAHPDSRPSHTEGQGKIVDLDGKNKKYLTLDDIGYGRGDGFLGFGCRHNWHLYIEGETPVYDKEELKELKEKSIKLGEEKKKEKSDLEEYKRLIKHREHITDLSKSYNKFKELKYNNKTEYDKIKLSQKNINNIKKGIEYFKESAVYKLSEIKENVARDLETYKKFKNENIEISNHAVRRYRDRERNFNFEELVSIINTEDFNYIQESGRRIKYYNNISIVYEKDIDVIVTIIKRRKDKKWRQI